MSPLSKAVEALKFYASGKHILPSTEALDYVRDDGTVARQALVAIANDLRVELNATAVSPPNPGDVHLLHFEATTSLVPTEPSALSYIVLSVGQVGAVRPGEADGHVTVTYPHERTRMVEVGMRCHTDAHNADRALRGLAEKLVETIEELHDSFDEYLMEKDDGRNPDTEST